MIGLIIIFFIFIVKTGSFVYVYKKPPFLKPVYWVAKKVGLKSVEECPFCAAFWVGMIVTAVDIFLIKSFIFNPFELLGYNIQEWYDNIIVIGLNGLSMASVCYFINVIEEFLEKD
jgi:hypothetical protein